MMMPPQTIPQQSNLSPEGMDDSYNNSNIYNRTSLNTMIRTKVPGREAAVLYKIDEQEGEDASSQRLKPSV